MNEHLTEYCKTMRFLSALFLVILAGVPCVAMACDATEVLVTTTPMPPANATRWKRHLELVDEVKAKKDASVVAIGDSLVAHWPMATLRLIGKPAINYGVSADRTQNILWRLSQSDLSLIHPRYVVILAGTNNLTANDSTCSIAAGLRAISAESRRNWPDALILILEIPPRGDNFSFRQTDRLQVNNEIKIIASEDGNSKAVSLEFLACGRFPCQNYRDDKLHFSPTAYDAITEKLRTEVH